MAGNGKLVDKGFTIASPKKLKGATLAEVDKNRKKNGLVDPNDRSTKFYSVTDVTIRVQTGSEVWYPGGIAFNHFKLMLNPQLLAPVVTVSSIIQVCVPEKLRSMSKEAQKEWVRFYKEVIKHEKQHVGDGKKLAEVMLKELAGLSVSLKTESVAEAQIKREALFELDALMNKTFGGDAIEKRINDEMKKRDSGGHGGMVLKTSIP